MLSGELVCAFATGCQESFEGQGPRLARHWTCVGVLCCFGSELCYIGLPHKLMKEELMRSQLKRWAALAAKHQFLSYDLGVSVPSAPKHYSWPGGGQFVERRFRYERICPNFTSMYQRCSPPMSSTVHVRNMFAYLLDTNVRAYLLEQSMCAYSVNSNS